MITAYLSCCRAALAYDYDTSVKRLNRPYSPIQRQEPR
jgi:hypothetical protein